MCIKKQESVRENGFSLTFFLFAGIFSRQFEKNNPVNARFLSSGTGDPPRFGQQPVHTLHTLSILYTERVYPYRVSIWCIYMVYPVSVSVTSPRS